MVAAALAARVVEVITDLGPGAGSRYRYGSGCIVRGTIVLTAAHVIAGAVSVVVRDPGKREYAAAVDPRFAGDTGGPGPDLALLEIVDPAFEGALPPVGLAAVDRDSAGGEPVERCHAVGYPWFAETRAGLAVRDTVDAIGVVPVLSKLAAGLLSMHVTIAPRALPPQQMILGESEWSGMSGAPVFAAGRLLGVVTGHGAREGSSALTAVPLTALEADPAHPGWGPGVADPPAWWARLGAGGTGDLQRLPVPPPPRPGPAYRATLRELGRALHQRMPQLLGRDRELAEIAAFATGGEGYRRLAGGAFAGKTALLYEAVTAGLPDEVDVICYFLSRRASDASSDRFLAAVVPQLASLCDVPDPGATRDQYHALWQQAAGRSVQSGRHLLLVVDGLDEDLRPPGSPSVASLLPMSPGTRTHVLVASRPHPELSDDVPGGHPLEVTSPVQLSPFAGAGELAGLAKKEISDLTRGDDGDLAVDVLGLLTAAAGALSLSDLAALRLGGDGTPAAADTWRVRRLVEDRAARSLERVGSPGDERYQFAHDSLREYATTMPDLCNPEYRQRIHRWADHWRDAGWPVRASAAEGTPRYLLDTYPSTLADDPQRLARLACDTGWVEAAVHYAGVDLVLASLREAAAADPGSTAVAGVLAAVTGQAQNLRPPQPLDQPGYIVRQLWMQAAELAEHGGLADELRRRLQSRPGPALVPRWTTRRAGRALSAELGRRDSPVNAVAVLPDGRVVTGGDDEPVLVWDPARPGAVPSELSRQTYWVKEMAVLPDGRVVTGEADQVLVWDPARPGAGPAELGRPDRPVNAVAVLPDGRVVTGGNDGRVLVWDPAGPGAGPAELGRHGYPVKAVAVLPDGRVVTGGDDKRVLVWDPARPGTGPAELGRHDGWVTVVAVLPDGRVITHGTGRQVLVWDPARPGTGPAELGRHGGHVKAVAVLADGRVVTGGQDGRVLVWDPAGTGAVPAELGRHDREVNAVAVLPHGRVVTGGDDGRVLVWDPAGTGPAGPGTGPAELGSCDCQVEAVVVLPDGRVITHGDERPPLVWDPAGPGADPAELGRYDGTVNAVAVLADGRVVTGSYDGQVLMWDPARPGTGPAELGRHDNWLSAVGGLPDGRVVTGGQDGQVLMWDPARPGAGPAELGRHDGWVTAVAVLPDGRVVTGGQDGRVLIGDPARPGTRSAELGRHDQPVEAVAVLPDGRVVTGGQDGRVLVWDPARPGTVPAELGRHDGWVHAVAVLPDGRVVTGGGDGRVLVWDPARPGTGPAELGRPNWMVKVAVLPDGRVVTGGGDGRVLVWDPAELGRCDYQVEAVAVLPDGRVITHGDEGPPLVWDPARPRAGPAELGRYDGTVDAVAVLADGRVVTDNYGRLLIWDPARPGTGPAELGRHDSWRSAVAGLPDGRVVTGGRDGRVLVWDPVRPGAGPAELGRYDGTVDAVAVLPDGRVVTGGQDGRVLVWDPARPGTVPAELGRHGYQVDAVAVLPDGRVITGGQDGRVLVWDPARPGTVPAELGRHGGQVKAVAVLPDGRVVTGGQDQRVLVWDPAGTRIQAIQLNCPVTALATTPASPAGSGLVIVHEGAGFSLWSFTG